MYLYSQLDIHCEEIMEDPFQPQRMEMRGCKQTPKTILLIIIVLIFVLSIFFLLYHTECYGCLGFCFFMVSLCFFDCLENKKELRERTGGAKGEGRSSVFQWNAKEFHNPISFSWNKLRYSSSEAGTEAAASIFCLVFVRRQMRGIGVHWH